MEKILVVEDDLFVREMYSDILRQDGYEIHTVNSGEEALARFHISDFALVIADIMAGGMSGLELLIRVKQIDPTVNVIIITGNSNVDAAIYALKNGARDYFIKPFNPDEFRHSVALTMEQYRLIGENNDLRQMITLYRKGQTIANCLELDRLYAVVVDTLASQTGSSRGLGFFYTENHELLLKYAIGFDEAAKEKLQESIASRLDRIPAHPVRLSPDALLEDDSAALIDTLSLKDVIIFPICSKSSVLGFVIFFNNSESRVPEDDSLLNQTFLLDQSCLAFENAQRFATTRNLIYIDELTGLYNYRYLDVALEREIRRAERYASPLAVIFIDLDLFKGVNDNYGHLVGSRVLRDVGDILRGSVREVDTMIRYGGDEFTVILVETGEKGAEIVSERIRKAIEEHCFRADDGTEIRLTASIGFACYPNDTTTRKDLLEMADMAMYRGKAEGRNLVFRAADLIKK